MQPLRILGPIAGTYIVYRPANQFAPSADRRRDAPVWIPCPSKAHAKTVLNRTLATERQLAAYSAMADVPIRQFPKPVRKAGA